LLQKAKQLGKENLVMGKLAVEKMDSLEAEHEQAENFTYK
jgi:hypothetical protein